MRSSLAITVTPRQKLWSFRLACIPVLLLFPFVCATITAVVADRVWHNDFPLVEVMLALLAGSVAAIVISFRTAFARHDSSLRRGVRLLAGIAAFDILGVPLAMLICTRPAVADRTGQKPGDVVREFISAVDADDYDKAASLFTKQSVNAIQHNSAHEYDFRTYCAHFKNLDSFDLGACRQGKGDYWNLTMSGQRSGQPVGYWFFFDRVGGKWLMVESEGSSFWDEPEETESHANLQIVTLRFHNDRNNVPTEANAEGKTVLIHRIDHARATPSHPILTESDGSFRCRIRPGIHEIEYEEINGALENQFIRYTVTTQVFEAGRSYVLNGYSTITLTNENETAGDDSAGGRNR